MRVSGGDLRGRALVVRKGLRPTGGRCKEALFSRWQSRIAGAGLLDLCAGSGSIGIEALSRGARRSVFVERDPDVLKSMRCNCALLVSEDYVTVHADVLPLPTVVIDAAPFDLVFADPPYDFDQFGDLLAEIARVLAANGEAAIEHSSRVQLPEPGRLRAHDSRQYGESRLSFFRQQVR